MVDRSHVTDITIEPEESFKAGAQPPVKPPDPRAQAEDEFAKLYRQQEQSNLPQLLKQARHRRVWLYITSSLALLLALALAGFFIFNGRNSRFGEEAVIVAISGPPASPSGQVVEYRLNYQNDQAVALTNLEVNLRYPEGFTFQESTPAPATPDGTRVTLDKVGAHQSGSIVIRGQLVGEVGEEKKFGAVFTYEPENFKAQFAKTVSASTQLVASVITVEATGPTQLPVDQPLTLSTTYKNSSANKLQGLVLQLTVPAGFELEVPTLAPVADVANTWKVNDLEPRGEGKFEFKGKFTSAAQPGNQEFRVAVALLASDSKTLTVQEEKVFSLTLIKSHLTLALSANDVSLKSTIDLGQEMAYELTYANEGDIPFSDLTLMAKLDTKFLDWTSLKDDQGGTVDAAAGTITWTKTTVPQLALLDSGARGTLSFRLRTQPTLPDNSPSPSFSAKIEAKGRQLVGDSLQNVSSESNEVVTKINTQFSLNVEGRYYTDQLVKLGSGPLPPQVGQTTTYVVFWQLSNTWSEVENVEVTATLPAGVTWTGQTTVTAGQKVNYNPNTREVQWQLNRLPVLAGTAFPKPEASFEVAITPEPNDADKILVLSKTTTAIGRDTYSGADLIATAKFITTELDEDLGAQGKGMVVR